MPPAAAPIAARVDGHGLAFRFCAAHEGCKKQADGGKSTTAFPPVNKKRKAPASLQGLERSILYAIAASGCIVIKRRE